MMNWERRKNESGIQEPKIRTMKITLLILLSSFILFPSAFAQGPLTPPGAPAPTRASTISVVWLPTSTPATTMAPAPMDAPRCRSPAPKATVTAKSAPPPVVQPAPAARLLFPWYFQPLATPDALNPILAHAPACDPQQGRDPSIAIAAILGSKGDDGSGQCILIRPHRRNIVLGSAGLADDAAGVTLRETVLLADPVDCPPPPLGAYKFPEATSLSTCFSSDRSATRRFRRTFSRSRSFIRFA